VSDTLKQQVIKELTYHQQEVDRLTKVLALLEDLGYPLSSSGGTVPEGSTPLKLYKRRSQSPEAKARISAYQKKKWKTIRAVQSGAVTLESLPPDQQDMIKHVQGIAVHPAISKAGTGLPHPRTSQEPSKDVTKSKRLRTR
jgi:hypothetical protein